jgi:CDP-diacylglycerol--serine O-phosphatidyltransferase
MHCNGLVTNSDFEMAFLFCMPRDFLDFFDGFFCTTIESVWTTGFTVDSLADMVTSGLVPGYVMFFQIASMRFLLSPMLPYLGFIITMGSCYRCRI